MLPAIFRCLVCAALLLGASSALSARIWIVDAAGGGDFRDLPAALQVVQPGDLVQLERGNYSGGTIPHPITLTGRGPATRILGALSASGLNAPGVLVIRSLSLASPARVVSTRQNSACAAGPIFALEICWDYPVGGLRFSRSSTPIHVSQVTAESFPPDEHPLHAGGPSLIAEDCSQLSLVESTFRPLGALGTMCQCWVSGALTRYPQIVVDAAQINGGFAVIDRCIFEGGHGQETGAFCSGGPSVGYPGFRGGDGLQLYRSAVVLHASVCKGGIGGDNHKFTVGNGVSCGYPCFPPTAGGNGIRIFDSVQAPISELELFASAIVGADGGRNVDPASCPPPYYPMQGRAGAPVMGALRALRNETYGLPMLQVSRELQLGVSAALRVDASGTGPIAVYVGTRWIPLRWSATVGGAVLDPTTGVHFLLGVTHARGAVSFALDRDPALLGFPLFFQGVQLDPPSGLVRLGPVIGDAVRG